MSNLNTLINGFDALSGAAFGGGGGGGGGGGRSPINSHPSAMTSAQYNHAYTAKSTSSSCVDKAIIGGIVSGAVTPGSVQAKIGTAAGATSIGLASCVISKF